MDHEIRLDRGHARDCLDQSVLSGWMRAGLEADVRVADLPERESPHLACLHLAAAQAHGARHSARKRPQNAGAAPQQALHGLAAAGAARIDYFAHAIDLRIDGPIRLREWKGAVHVEGHSRGTSNIPPVTASFRWE